MKKHFTWVNATLFVLVVILTIISVILAVENCELEKHLSSMSVPTFPSDTHTNSDVTAFSGNISAPYQEYLSMRQVFLIKHYQALLEFGDNPEITPEFLKKMEYLNSMYDDLRHFYYSVDRQQVSGQEWLDMRADIVDGWICQPLYNLHFDLPWHDGSIDQHYVDGSWETSFTIRYANGILEMGPKYLAHVVWTQNLEILQTGDPGDYRSWRVSDPSQEAYLLVEGETGYMVRICPP